ncbi:MAG: hypothetical protein AB7O37_04770 [Vicinamibacteria bacterium]
MSSIVALAAFVAFCLAVWNVAPVYMADYVIGDRMVEICRLGRGMNSDDAILERLMKVVREERLEDYIDRYNFKIETRESSRRITLEYERTYKILPGWSRNQHFSRTVDEPFF